MHVSLASSPVRPLDFELLELWHLVIRTIACPFAPAFPLPAGSDVPKPLATGETVDARCLPSTWTCSSAFGMPSMKLFISLIVEIPLRSSGPSLAQYSVPVATSHVPVRGVRPSNGRAPVTPPVLARDPAISVVLVARAHVEYFGRRAAVAMPGRLRCRLDRRNARKMTHASEIQPPEPARMSSVRAA